MWDVLSWGMRNNGRTEEGDRTRACSGEHMCSGSRQWSVKILRNPCSVVQSQSSFMATLPRISLHGGRCRRGRGQGMFRSSGGLASTGAGAAQGAPLPSPCISHRCCLTRHCVPPELKWNLRTHSNTASNSGTCVWGGLRPRWSEGGPWAL